MPLINIPVGIAPCQIDDFPKTVGEGEDAKPFERSCKGALHIRPASTKVLTEHELDHIKNHHNHKMLARRMVVVKVDVVPDDSPRSKAKVTDEQEAKAAVKVKMREAGKAAPTAGKQAEAPESSPEPTSSEGSAKESGSRSRRRRGSSES